jgi:hypothetical protein
MTLDRDQKLKIFCAVLQAVVTAADPTQKPGQMVQRAAEIATEAIGVATQSAAF